MTRRTLAEIDATCRKAARGAGCDWGLAEEAGRAARWLAAHGLPGPEALAALLAEDRRCRLSVVAGGFGTPPRVCPIPLGAALADRAQMLTAQAHYDSVVRPLLLLPQAARVAAALGRAIAVDWDGFGAICMPAGLALIETTGMEAPLTQRVTCRPAAPAPVTHAFGHGACVVAPEPWAALERLAHRTYVPATEASRQAGAGAGLTDND